MPARQAITFARGALGLDFAHSPPAVIGPCGAALLDASVVQDDDLVRVSTETSAKMMSCPCD